ncbi:hypothetical protein D9M69_372730 [compost metagenome]
MVSATRPSIRYSEVPLSQVSPALKCSIWASAMMIANPLTKPSITGYGTMRTSLPRRNRPKAIMISPPSSTVANRYCTPCCTTSATITTAIEPAAPEIIPGRPPNRAVRVQMMKAPYRPISGLRWATSAKAMHSGTRAKDVVSPARTSARRRAGFMAYLRCCWDRKGREWYGNAGGRASHCHRSLSLNDNGSGPFNKMSLFFIKRHSP